MEITELKQAYSIPHMLRVYGIEPNRNGFINCLNHTDKNASMKVYEKKLKCFSACQCSWDIIDLCAHIHNETDTKAVLRQIHSDLGLTYSEQNKPDTERLNRLKREREEKERTARIKNARTRCRTDLHRKAWEFCKRTTEITDELIKQQRIKQRCEEWLDKEVSKWR